MTNDEQLLAELKIEVGWLRNELNSTRPAFEQQGRQLKDLRRTLQRLEQAMSGWSPWVR